MSAPPYLILACGNGCLRLLNNYLLSLSLLCLDLQRLTSLNLDLPWLHQLNLQQDNWVRCIHTSNYLPKYRQKNKMI